jgi:hypothetical protein
MPFLEFVPILVDQHKWPINFRQGIVLLIAFTPLSDRAFPQFSLSPDPSAWGGDLSLNHAEPDDYLHNPDPKRDRASDGGGHIFTARGLANLGCIVFLAVGIITLLYALLFPAPKTPKLIILQRWVSHYLAFHHKTHVEHVRL